MMIIYPIGVPFWFALTLFRNKEQLNELQVRGPDQEAPQGLLPLF
jgi:hypothetical protein